MSDEAGFYIPPDECRECGEDYDLCECGAWREEEPPHDDPGELKEWQDFDPDC